MVVSVFNLFSLQAGTGEIVVGQLGWCMGWWQVEFFGQPFRHVLFLDVLEYFFPLQGGNSNILRTTGAAAFFAGDCIVGRPEVKRLVE